jgi:hypothetical protein
MTILLRRGLLAALAATAAARAAAAAEPPRANILDLKVDYSATSLIGSGENPQRGRLWRNPRGFRHEGAQDGRAQTVIARLDRNLGWLALTDLGVAIETDLSALDLPVDILDGGGGVTQRREGRERVNGMDTTRVRVERKAGAGSRFSGRVWVTDQGVIARIDGEGESRGRRGRTLMNFRDVRVGAFDPRLLEPPSDLRIVRVRGGDVGPMIESLEALGNLGKRRS